jgi:hypothetical protein
MKNIYIRCMSAVSGIDLKQSLSHYKLKQLLKRNGR